MRGFQETSRSVCPVEADRPVDRITSDAVEASILRAYAEFLEMPGLKLTVPQAQRLWGMDRETCQAVIAELLSRELLSLTSDGSVVLA